MIKERDLSIDYAKGLAILLVYLGHSILYYPIALYSMYDWCNVLERMITSFNMPMFFFISGLLFAFSRKSNKQVMKDKVRRLLVPYLFTMAIVLSAKQLMPSSMAYKSEMGGGNILTDIFVYGGDRWFVYVLMWVFLLSLPIRKLAMTPRVFLVIAISFAVTFLGVMPKEFLIKDVVRFLPFFLLGMYANQFYAQLNCLFLKYWWFLAIIFCILNVLLVVNLMKIPITQRLILPLTGTSFFMALAFVIENIQKHNNHKSYTAHYIAYCGRYSLQFYLFTFAYPIIRTVVVNVWHITNPFAIVGLVMIMQLLVITMIIEITRRIKILKIPMGY